MKVIVYVAATKQQNTAKRQACVCFGMYFICMFIMDTYTVTFCYDIVHNITISLKTQ